MKKLMRYVHSGSGTRYPCFIGAHYACEEADLVPSEACGTSGGAIIAAGIAAGMTPVQLEELAKSTLPGPLLDVFDFHWLPSITAARGRWGGIKILDALRHALPPTWSGYRLPLHIVTFNIERGVHVVWNARSGFDDVPLLVRASMSLPFVFDPVVINGEMHVDGGVGANFPLDIFGTGADVIGMRFRGTDPNKPHKVATKYDLGMALLDGLMEATTREHVHEAMFARVMLLETTNGGLTLYMGKKDVDAMISEGRTCADAWLRDMPPMG